MNLKALALSLLTLPACLLPCTLVAALGTAQDTGDSLYARPGQLINEDGFRLNLSFDGDNVRAFADLYNPFASEKERTAPDEIFARQSSEYIQFDEPDIDLAHSPTAKTRAMPAGTAFRECPECPEMVIVPAGHFVMGASPGEEEREKPPAYFRGHSVPQHSVMIQHSFAIARFDVTRDEYAQFVSETKRPDPDSCYTPDASGGESHKRGANWYSPGFPQTGRDPVVCVSWDDAQAYVAWLSGKTGHVYRLPTESEWEYAARAGTTTARYGSDRSAELCSYINHADLDFSRAHPSESGVNRECRDRFGFTSPVGSLTPNQFGLYDMLGNVWQWTEDCWNNDYTGAPSDGTSWQSGDCARRVMRGGAYSLFPALVRSSVRLGPKSSAHDHSGGFRVAKTIE